MKVLLTFDLTSLKLRTTWKPLTDSYHKHSGHPLHLHSQKYYFILCTIFSLFRSLHWTLKLVWLHMCTSTACFLFSIYLYFIFVPESRIYNIICGKDNILSWIPLSQNPDTIQDVYISAIKLLKTELKIKWLLCHNFCRTPCRWVREIDCKSKESSHQYGRWGKTLPVTGTCHSPRKSLRTPELLLLAHYVLYGLKINICKWGSLHECSEPENGEEYIVPSGDEIIIILYEKHILQWRVLMTYAVINLIILGFKGNVLLHTFALVRNTLSSFRFTGACHFTVMACMILEYHKYLSFSCIFNKGS